MTERSASPGDSAGASWSGRTLPAAPFAGDSGAADPQLASALAAQPQSAERVIAALAQARVFTAVLAIPGEVRSTEHGPADASAEMALVTLTNADGLQALPLFSTPKAMAQWNPKTRPVPVATQRAALTAVAQGCDLLVLDPVGPVTFVVARAAMWALGQGRTWLPPSSDPQVHAELQRLADALPGVALRAAQASDDLTELVIEASLAPGWSAEQVRELGGRIAQAVQTSELLRERAEQVRLSLRTSPH